MRAAPDTVDVPVHRQQAWQDYPAQWRQVVSAWQQPGEDAAWLIYSANYLFRTAGVRWALDPLTLWARQGLSSPVDAAADLAALDFIVLTHAHRDHFDPRLLFTLSRLPARWVVPEFLLAAVQPLTSLEDEQIITARPGFTLQLGSLRLTPFEGVHWEWAQPGPDGHPTNGVPALGYLAEFNGRRWLFPGDTRTYQPSRLPSFGKLDGVFMHLWLGRRAALQPQPPLLDDFCRFILALGAPQVVLTHLEEWGRPPAEFWEARHCRLVQERLRQIAPGLAVSSARTGDEVPLHGKDNPLWLPGVAGDSHPVASTWGIPS